MIESVAGMISAAPTPINARMRMTCARGVGEERTQAGEPEDRDTTCNASLRPSRSPSVPNTSSRPANTSR